MPYVKFCFTLRMTAPETNDVLKTAFGNNPTGRTKISEWFCYLKCQESLVDNCEHPGC